MFKNSTDQNSDFEKLNLLKGNKTYESILNDISENFKDIKMNFDNCDEIFEDGKTCKEYAESLAFSRTFANDPVCKKSRNRYRNKYRNLNKQASLSNNPEVQILYEKYKSDGAKMLKKYQHRKITDEEFEK